MASAKKTILLIEDEPHIVMGLRDALEFEGFRVVSAGRGRDYRLRIEESDGSVRERDEFSSFVSVWRVTPDGAGSNVTVETSWTGAGGIGGIFERLFAPLGLRRIYGEVLDRLAASVQG